MHPQTLLIPLNAAPKVRNLYVLMVKICGRIFSQRFLEMDLF